MDKYYERAYKNDLEDPLGAYRKLFKRNENEIYLDGNSLGLLPLATITRIQQVVKDEWGTSQIRSWNEKWLDLSEKVAAKIAKLLGVEADEIFVGDSTSLNLYKLAYATLNYQGNRSGIITDDLNFPSDRYVVEGLISSKFKNHHLTTVSAKDGKIHFEDLQKALDHNTALMTFSHVAYHNAFRYDMASVNKLAKDYGTKVIWDLSHSAGAIPINLKDSGAELAVGCTYKYLNGGPGSPAFLYVKRELQEKLENPIWSWFGHDAPFSFKKDFVEARDIKKFGISTPPILSLAAIETGLNILLDAGMDNIYQKGLLQSAMLLEMIQEQLVPRGFTIRTPVEPVSRGSHISISHPKAYKITRAMIDPGENSNTVIIPDFRLPDMIRIGITPLYTSFTELVKAIARIMEIADNHEMDKRQFEDLVVI